MQALVESAAPPGFHVGFPNYQQRRSALVGYYSKRGGPPGLIPEPPDLLWPQHTWPQTASLRYVARQVAQGSGSRTTYARTFGQLPDVYDGAKWYFEGSCVGWKTLGCQARVMVMQLAGEEDQLRMRFNCPCTHDVDAGGDKAQLRGQR